MSTPEYIICMECETPVYEFTWKEGEVVEAECFACGNDNPEQFITEEDYEAFRAHAHRTDRPIAELMGTRHR